MCACVFMFRHTTNCSVCLCLKKDVRRDDVMNQEYYFSGWLDKLSDSAATDEHMVL